MRGRIQENNHYLIYYIMPSSRPAYTWPIRLSFTLRGRKPHKARLPGVEVLTHGVYEAGGRKVHIWGCAIDGLFAN